MSFLSRATTIYRIQGPAGVAQSAFDRVAHRTVSLAPHAAAIASASLSAIEIGGPSTKFRAGRLLPTYPFLTKLDNVNFAGATLWEKDLRDGGPFAPVDEHLGTQYLREASDLQGISDGTYDLLLSSHTLEHLANPLLALREWRRVTRHGGHLFLVLPHRDGTFDHRRPITPLDHLRDDAAAAMPETDPTHLEEILRLHDIARDPGSGSMAVLRARLADNISNRGAHHHVFNLDLAIRVVEEAGWVPLAAEARRPHDQVVLARNGGGRPNHVPRRSPFRSDR